MDSAGPEGLRLRESSSLYFAELFVVVLDGKVLFMNQHVFPVLDIAQWELRVGMYCYDGGYVSQEHKLVIPFVL